MLEQSGIPVSGPSVEQVIAGTVIAGGVECPLLKLADGRVFTLQGVGREDVTAGQALRVAGRPVMTSYCQQGPAFVVREIVKAR